MTSRRLAHTFNHSPRHPGARPSISALTLVNDFITILSGATHKPFTNADVVYGGVADDTTTWPTREQAAGKFVLIRQRKLQDGLGLRYPFVPVLVLVRVHVHVHSSVPARLLHRNNSMSLSVSLIVRPPGDDAVVERLRAVVKGLRAAGHHVAPRMTFEAYDAARFARASVRRRFDIVLAAGGDGTINEVVNGLVGQDWQPRLGIIPIGTANDFARTLHLPSLVEDAVEVALAGRPVAVDVGVANRRCFINVSTGGFGAEATARVPQTAKRKLGKLAYVLTGARKLIEMKPRAARFTGDDGEIYQGEFYFFAVGNARRTGGGTLVTPRAEFGDCKLDVVIVPALGRLNFLALLPDLHAGTHLESDDVIYVRTRELEVQAQAPLPVNVDGEAMRARVFRYRINERPLSVMTPWSEP